MTRPLPNLSTHPVGLVPSPWLGSKLGVSGRDVWRWSAENAVPCLLTRADAQHFPQWPSSFSPWVTAWGLERVLAWLDEYAPSEAAFVRDNVDRLHDRARDDAERKAARRASHLACVKRRNDRLGAEYIRLEKREAARKKQVRRTSARVAARVAAGLPAEAENVYADIQRRKRDRTCSPHPVGFVPDNDIERVTGVGRTMLARYRKDHEIAAYQPLPGRTFGTWVGAFRPLIAGWGVDLARAWVAEWMPALIKAFERDVAVRESASMVVAPVAQVEPPKSRRGEVGKQKNKQVIAMNEVVKKAKERDLALGRLPIITPGSNSDGGDDKRAERAQIADAMAEFLARGGKVTKIVGAGSSQIGQVVVREFGGMDV